VNIYFLLIIFHFILFNNSPLLRFLFSMLYFSHICCYLRFAGGDPCERSSFSYSLLYRTKNIYFCMNTKGRIIILFTRIRHSWVCALIRAQKSSISFIYTSAWHNSRSRLLEESKKYIDTKQSNKRNNQNSKDKRQDYNMK